MNDDLMRITVDVDKCIGNGQCVVAADDYFTQDEDTGLVIVLRDEVGEERRAAVVEAVRVCPVQVIKLVDPTS